MIVRSMNMTDRTLSTWERGEVKGYGALMGRRPSSWSLGEWGDRKKSPHPASVLTDLAALSREGRGHIVIVGTQCLSSAQNSPLPSRERAGAEGDRVRGFSYRTSQVTESYHRLHFTSQGRPC